MEPGNEIHPIIDVADLARKYGVSKNEIAAVIYPDNEYPGQALTRINKIGCNIKAAQIVNLSQFLGCRPGDVFAAPAGSFKHVTEASTGLHVFTKGDLRITLDAKSGVTLIYEAGENTMQTVIHDTAVPMDAYLQEIEQLISVSS